MLLNRNSFMLLINSHRMNQILTIFTQSVPTTVLANKACILSLTSFTESGVCLIITIHIFFSLTLSNHFLKHNIMLEPLGLTLTELFTAVRAFKDVYLSLNFRWSSTSLICFLWRWGWLRNSRKCNQRSTYRVETTW